MLSICEPVHNSKCALVWSIKFPTLQLLPTHIYEEIFSSVWRDAKEWRFVRRVFSYLHICNMPSSS